MKLNITAEQAEAELRKRALRELRERDVEAFKREIVTLILMSMTRKQREVLADIDSGIRYLALCCGRRAGKTNLLAKLIVLTLLKCGHNEAVFYIAWSLKIGKGLIWQELEKTCEDYGLWDKEDEDASYWKLAEHSGEIHTPERAAFFILGLNKTKQKNLTRGFKSKLFCADESQDIEHLLAGTLVAVAPGLSDMAGVFIAAGTGPYVDQGAWYDWAQGLEGFKAYNWTVRDNEKFPRDPEEVLAEELRDHFDGDATHPDFVREWMGRAANDVRTLAVEFVSSKNITTELPEHYSLAWRHVIGMDYGWDDAVTWVVVAANQYGPERIVVHAEAHSKIDNDEVSNITGTLVKRFATKHVVCDYSGGGKNFYETFNARYGKELKCRITGAKKLGKVDSVKVINTEMRKGRIKVLMEDGEPLVRELRVLRWKDKQAGEMLTSDEVRDDCFDAFRYAMVEIAPWQEKTPLSEEQKSQREAAEEWKERCKVDPEAREREERNRAARRQKKEGWTSHLDRRRP